MNTAQQNKSFTLWPYAIVVCMVLFMGYIAHFVYKAMNQDVGLVSKDYYQQEIQNDKYQSGKESDFNPFAGILTRFQSGITLTGIPKGFNFCGVNDTDDTKWQTA